MKKSILLSLFLFSFSLIYAQDELLVHQGENGLFLHHTVAPKESFYSVGRLYNVAPKEIAAFNNLDMNNGLNIGQALRIPLNASNFSQSSANGRPVYYEVEQSEGLYRVSVKNNNVLMADIRKWNQLSSDILSPGQKLIIGYLVSVEGTAGLSDPLEKKDEAVEEKDVVVETIPEVQDEKKKEVVKNEEVKPDIPMKVSQQENNSVEMGGYFKSHFDLQIKKIPVQKDLTASAGIFKTSSGWQDKKYYALIDGVETGTIIKIINPTNNRSIYAKVLGEMSGIRQNQGYDVRISNAAASALEVSDTEKFIVRVNY